MKRKPKPIKKPKHDPMIRLGADIPASLKSAVQAQALHEDRPFQRVVRRALEMYLQESAR